MEICIIRYGALLGVYHDWELTRYLESRELVQLSRLPNHFGKCWSGEKATTTCKREFSGFVRNHGT